MPFDFVIALSLIVVLATLAGLVYAVRFVMQHIARDSECARQENLVINHTSKNPS